MRYRLFRFVCICILAVLLPVLSPAQSITGTVTDSVTGAPLAFVSLVLNDGPQGTRTDIDGRYSLLTNQTVVYIKVSYLGYKPKKVLVQPAERDVNISLAPVHYELSAVEIFPGENPAHILIRKLIQNRNINNPEKLPSFSCNTYNKIVAEWMPGENYYKALQDSSRIDSSVINLVQSASEQHLLMMESYTRRIFMSPAHSKETVLATRVSGFRDPSFAPMATDVQPFSFYENVIKLNTGVVTGYQNPVGEGAIGRYSYLIQDTLYDGSDSIFVISYHPLKSKSFNGLKGIVYINSSTYAIQNIIAEPADEGLWKIRVQQQYSRCDGLHWFPEQLNYEWILPKYPSDKIGLKLNGKSYISSVGINIPLKASDFGPDEVLMSDSAAKRKTAEWDAYRNDPLDTKEIRTYTYMDSLGRKMNLDYYTRAIPAVLDGYLPVGPLEMQFDKIYTSNSSEGNRLGLGLRTGERIAKWFWLGGYFGYGFKDKAWKYGGDLVFKIWRKNDVELFARYRYDLREPGLTTLSGFQGSSYWFRQFGKQFDDEESLETGFRFRSLKFLQTEISLRQISLTPRYDYSYADAAGMPDSSFLFSELTASFRYAVRDKITNAFGRRFSDQGKYPVFFATYTVGLSDFLRGEYPYSKLELAVAQTFDIRNFGRMSLLAEAGTIWGDVPYPRLFRGKGSYGGDISLFLANSFQTMRPAEFACDRYVNVFFRHNFGNFLFKGKKFKPEFTLAHNLCFGDLRQNDKHLGLVLKAPVSGFYEAGLIVDNLIRIKLLNIAYLGLGVGGFYRYGAYSFDTPIKNLSGKISFRISGI
jgi:hypothetical protein